MASVHYSTWRLQCTPVCTIGSATVRRDRVLGQPNGLGVGDQVVLEFRCEEQYEGPGEVGVVSCQMDAPASGHGQVMASSCSELLKIFQLGGLAAFALPLAEYADEGQLSVGTIAAVTAVVGGAGAASAALWYYSRRYVGEMALMGPYLKDVQLSVIDFWVIASAIIPPLKGLLNTELEEAANQVLIPLDVIGERQFFFSLRHGRLIEKDVLLALLHGNLDSENLQNLVQSRQAV